MERAGVRADEAVLAELSTEYQGALDRIEGEIYALAGEEFLVSSPKQLQRILFEKLKLPVIKKTKTGYSTDEGVLEQLAAQHDLPGADPGLPKARQAEEHLRGCASPARVNPSAPAASIPPSTSWGPPRAGMSAANPNVQNIPIRTEEGVRIREAFVPAEGCRLVSADYSQVELRILAHYTERREPGCGLPSAATTSIASTAAEVLGVWRRKTSPRICGPAPRP